MSDKKSHREGNLNANDSPPQDIDMNANRQLLRNLGTSPGSPRPRPPPSPRRTSASEAPQNWRRGERPATSQDTLIYRARWQLIVHIAAITYYLQRKSRQLHHQLKIINEGLRKM